MAYQTYKLTWQGINIEARYDPEYCKDVVAHLELESINPPRAQLPMTQTGYRSHFHPIGMIEAKYGGDIIAVVTNWLKNKTKPETWRAQIDNAKQQKHFCSCHA